jgi:hypothetical protein
VWAAGKDEVLLAARLVVVAGHDDGTFVGRGFAVDGALGVDGPGAATAIGDKPGDVAGAAADERKSKIGGYLAALTASVKAGTTSNRSPTMP